MKFSQFFHLGLFLSFLWTPFTYGGPLLHKGMGVSLFQSGILGDEFILVCTPKDLSYARHEPYVHTRIFMDGYIAADYGVMLNSRCSLATDPLTTADLKVIPTGESNKVLLAGYFAIQQKRASQLPPIFRMICHTTGGPRPSTLNVAMNLHNDTDPSFIGLDFSCNLQHFPRELYYSDR